MSIHFQVWNPSYLGEAISTIPMPLEAKYGAKRGSGPVRDMCYILFERNHTVGRDDAVENPTKDNHTGWNMIGEGIFKGWEESSGEQKGGVRNLWRPIFHARDSTNKILNSDEERELIKFKRVYIDRYGPDDPDKYWMTTASNKITNHLCWVECEYYIHPIKQKQGVAKLKMLSSGRDGNSEKLPPELQSKILSINLPNNITPPLPSTPEILFRIGGKRKSRRKSRKKRGGHHLYRTLRVSKYASQKQIRKAYIKLKKKKKLTKNVKYAYKILSKKKTRKQYNDRYKKRR